MKELKKVQLIEKIQTLCDELSEKAFSRRGGAWTTGGCVVGKDMASGLCEAQNVIQEYIFPLDKSITDQCRELASLIREEASRYPFHDSEGYAESTMLELAQQIENLDTSTDQRS